MKNQEINEFVDWYKNYFEKDRGIWIGPGIDNQYSINMIERRDLQGKCNFSFGYVVNQGYPTLIKLLEMEGEDNNNG